MTVSALRCAFELVDVDVVLHARVGLYAGEVVRATNDVFRHTVTLAARIAGAARGSEVLVSEVGRQLVAGFHEFEFRDRRDMALMGFDESQPVYRACPSGAEAAAPLTAP